MAKKWSEIKHKASPERLAETDERVKVELAKIDRSKLLSTILRVIVLIWFVFILIRDFNLHKTFFIHLDIFCVCLMLFILWDSYRKDKV